MMEFQWVPSTSVKEFGYCFLEKHVQAHRTKSVLACLSALTHDAALSKICQRTNEQRISSPAGASDSN